MMINLIQELNEQQAQAVTNPLEYCTKIVAGAGTGKTKIISKRFLKLVSIDKVAPEQILVITFTDKASGEMKERILKELSGVKFEEKNLWISTFHSFCSRILAEHLEQIGFSSSRCNEQSGLNLRHCEEQSEEAIFPDNRLLSSRNDVEDELFRPEGFAMTDIKGYTLASEGELLEIFEEIITALKQNKIDDDMVSIAAGLGLEGLIFDLDNLTKLSKIAPLDELFASVFEIIKKIKSYGLTPFEFLQKTLSANKNYSKTVCGLDFGYENKDNYFASWQNILKPYVSGKIDIDEIAKSKTVLNKNGSSKAERWCAGTGFPEKISEIDAIEEDFTKLVATIYAIYQEKLRKKSMLDFDDLINKTLELLKENSVVRKFYQEKFKHIIIDEFQDTNGSQLELIKLLINENHPNITFVGDRKQSIYGFRHAQMENLDSLHEFIENKFKQKFPEIKLKTNYRSSADVIDAVNFVTENILELDENLEAFFGSAAPVVTTKFCDGKNTSELKMREAEFIAQEILKIKEDGGFKDFAVLVKSHFQADFIERILARYSIPSVKKVNTGYFERPLVKDVVALFRLLNKKPDEMALVRILQSKMNQAELYSFVLGVNDVTREMEGKPNLYEKIEALRVGQILKQVQDDVVGVADGVAGAQDGVAGAQDGVAGAQDGVAGAQDGVVGAQGNVAGVHNMPVIQDIFEFIEKNQDLDLKEIFANAQRFLQSDFDCDIIESNKIEIEYKIFEMIIDNYIKNRKYVSVFEFLKFFENLPTDSNYTLPNPIGEDIDAVNLLTVHASKGLEFANVFLLAQSKRSQSSDNVAVLDLQYGEKLGFGLLINKFEGKLSPKMALYKSIWHSPREKAEKDRLFYVALSRAQKYLNVMTFDEIKLSEHLIVEK